MRLLPCMLALALLAPLPLAAWGRKGHDIVASLAFRDLPGEVAPWFQGREATLREHCNDPDEWRLADHREAPNHFLNADTYGGPALVPRSIRAARAQLGAEAFEQNGQVPWVIQDRVDRLARAFRSGDPAEAAWEAAILCHYVGDLNVPLHTSANHDGQQSGQLGIHHRWESGLVERLGPGTRSRARPPWPGSLGTPHGPGSGKATPWWRLCFGTTLRPASRARANPSGTPSPRPIGPSSTGARARWSGTSWNGPASAPPR